MDKSFAAAMLLSVFTLVCAPAAWATPGVAFTDLGVIQEPSGAHSVWSVGWAINASGKGTGYAQVSSGGIDPGYTKAFVYSNGTISDLNLGGLDGGTAPNVGNGYGINNSGTIVGAVGDPRLPATRAFVTSGGAMTTMDLSDSTMGQSRAYSVNSSGTVVGAAYWTLNQWNALIYNYSGTYNPTTGVYSGGTWSWNNINSVLGGTGSGMTLAINDTGTVTGYVPSGANSNNGHPFVRTSSGTVTDLGTLGGASGRGNAINANGDVAGNALGSDGQSHAFLAVNGPSGYSGLTDLGIPAGFTNSNGLGVNKYDMVAGQAYDGTANRPFLWTTRVVPFYGLSVGVNDISAMAASVLPSGWTLTNVRSINDAGQMIGVGTYSGNSRAFIISLPQALPGDATVDGTVDSADMSKVLTNYNQAGMHWGDGDFDGNGSVDIQDLSSVLSNYNRTAAAAAGLKPVPEPGMLVLLLAALVALGGSAWRKGK